MFFRSSFLFLLLTLAVAADTIKLQGVDVTVRNVEGRQVISREDAAQAFPNIPEDIEYIELSKLVEHPSARLTRRDGKVTAIRFYNSAMGEMWDSVKKDLPERPENEQVAQPNYQPARTSSKSRDGGWEIQEETYKRSNRRKVEFKQDGESGKNRIEQLRDEVDRGKRKR